MMQFNGKTYAVPMNGIQNSGPAFEEARRHGADGRLQQAFGATDVGTYNGDNRYKSERQNAGEKNGRFKEKTPSLESQFAMRSGHIYELPCAEANAMIMSLETGYEITVHPAGEAEYRNAQWNDLSCHIDFLLRVKGGKIVPNPRFYIGGAEKNWTIIPSEEDHWYIADSKTVQSPFGANWSTCDEQGIPTGGLKNGVAPEQYYDQMQAYCLALNIEGAMLLAMSKADLTLNSYAQVYVPCDIEKAEKLLDNAQMINERSKKGILPAVKDCKNKELAIRELARQFPAVNAKRRFPKLDADEWSPIFSEVEEIHEKIAALEADLDSQIPDELKELMKATEAEVKALREEAKLLMLSSIEALEDAPCGWFKDPDTGDTIKVEQTKYPSVSKDVRDYLRKFHPEIYDELLIEIPDVKVKVTREYADRTKPAKVMKSSR